MDQVSVGRVNFHDLEFGLQCAGSRRCKVCDDLLDAFRGELDRIGKVTERNRARGGHRLPRESVVGGQALAAAPRTCVDALRPAWASWIPGTAPKYASCALISAKACACVSFQIPRSAADMRPSGLTAVASVRIRPVPPIARLTRCVRCHSLGTPTWSPMTSAEYWHIGAIQTRFGMVTPRRSKARTTHSRMAPDSKKKVGGCNSAPPHRNCSPPAVRRNGPGWSQPRSAEQAVTVGG